MSRTLSVTFYYTLDGFNSQKYETELSGDETLEDIKTAIAEQEDDSEEKYAIAIDTVESDEDVPTEYLTLEKIFEFAEAYSECDQDDMEVIEAALELDIKGSDIDEAYQGRYSDDQAFAQEMADQLGAVDKNAGWPNNCIDWEFAAKELMYDYSEQNCHYFRNL